MKYVQLFSLAWFCVGNVLAQNYLQPAENVLCDGRAALPGIRPGEYNIWLRPIHNEEKSPGELVYLTFDFVIKPMPSSACCISIEPVVDVPFITTGAVMVAGDGFKTLGFTLMKPGQVTQVRFKIEDYVSPQVVFEKIVNIQQTFTKASLTLMASDPHHSDDL